MNLAGHATAIGNVVIERMKQSCLAAARGDIPNEQVAEDIKDALEFSWLKLIQSDEVTDREKRSMTLEMADRGAWRARALAMFLEIAVEKMDGMGLTDVVD
jgi:hypothetical protein